MNKKRGFTLIELLVVISIISLLSSVIITSVGSARNKANDSSTIRNLKAIQTSFELYQTDYSRYPKADACSSSSPFCTYSFDTDLKPLLEPKYISKLVNKQTGASTSVAGSGDFYYMVVNPTNTMFYCNGSLAKRYLIYFFSAGRSVSNVPVLGFNGPAQLATAGNYYHCVSSTD